MYIDRNVITDKGVRKFTKAKKENHIIERILLCMLSNDLIVENSFKLDNLSQ